MNWLALLRILDHQKYTSKRILRQCRGTITGSWNQGVSAHFSCSFLAANGLTMIKYSSLFTHQALRTDPYIGEDLPLYMGRYHWIPWPILGHLLENWMNSSTPDVRFPFIELSNMMWCRGNLGNLVLCILYKANNLYKCSFYRRHLDKLRKLLIREVNCCLWPISWWTTFSSHFMAANTVMQQ